jgi:hypothetical protein
MRMSRQPAPVQFTIDQKQLENVKYCKYLDSVITNDARHTWEIKTTIDKAKAEFNKEKALCTFKLDLNLRKKLIKCYIWGIDLYGAEI